MFKLESKLYLNNQSTLNYTNSSVNPIKIKILNKSLERSNSLSKLSLLKTNKNKQKFNLLNQTLTNQKPIYPVYRFFSAVSVGYLTSAFDSNIVMTNHKNPLSKLSK